MFKDIEKLLPRHIPSHLPHRELHINMLRGLFKDFLERPGETYERVVQLYGPVGSGKTSTTYRFGVNYQAEASMRGVPLSFIHVNCKLEGGSRFILYQTILQRLAPELATRGHSSGEMLRLIVHYLRVEGKYLLLALDDVDYLVRRSKEEEREGGVVYDLTRLSELYLGEYQNIIGVIFIARDPGFLELLDPSERSSLGNIVVRLPSYDSRQLRDILAARVDEAFKPGAVDEETISYVADLAASRKENSGDCRFALDVMLTSGLIADAEGAKKVSIEHVRRAVGEEFWGLSSEDLLNLDEQGVAILMGAIQALQHRRTPYVSIKEVYDFYLVSCEAQGIRSLSYNGVLERVRDLSLRGILDYREDRGLSIAGASLEDLSRMLRGLERRKTLA